MRNIYKISISALIILSITSSIVSADPVSIQTCTKFNTTTNKYDRGTDIPLNNARLTNNIWGVASVNFDFGFQQCIYKDRSGKIGWTWNRPGSYGTGPTYPTIIIGRHPWDPRLSSTWSQLPKKVSEISSFKYTMTHKYLEQTGTNLNFAPEIWLTDTLLQTDTKKLELMIWVNCVGACNGNLLGDFNDSYHDYKVYVKIGKGSNNQSWNYAMFVKQPVDMLSYTDYTVDIKVMIDYLKSKESQILLIQPAWQPIDYDWYLTNLELGNEIARTNGGTGDNKISKLDIELNGNTTHIVPSHQR